MCLIYVSICAVSLTLKVAKCEIFHHSDFHSFYTMKPFWVDDFVFKILTYYFNFGGSRPSLVSNARAEYMRKELMRLLRMRISSLHERSVHATVPDTYAQHGLKALFKFGISTLMLSIRRKELMHMLSEAISSRPVCSVFTSVSDAYAQRVLKGLRSLKLD
jgi:hypothetical protein